MLCAIFGHKPADLENYPRLHLDAGDSPVEVCERCGSLFMQKRGYSFEGDFWRSDMRAARRSRG
jgi:hypothetical protein